MPSLDEIRTITIRSEAQGFDESAAKVNKLSDATANLGVVSDTTTKATTSIQNAVDRQARSLDTVYRSQQQFAKSQATLNQGFDMGILGLSRYNELSAMNSERLKAATESHTAFSKAIDGARDKASELSRELGPVGTALSALGPIGIAAGAAIIIAYEAFNKMSEAADALAGKAQALSNFALITGLTTDQVQALTETSAKFGVSTETTQKFIDQFTSKLTELRTASGPLYDAILKVDAGIAKQMLTAQSTTEELDLYAEAYKKAAAAGNGNALLLAAGGRGGITAAPVIGAIADAGGLNQLNAAMDQGSRLAAAEINHLKDLKSQNDELKENIQNNIESLFSEAILKNQVESRTTILGLTEALKGFKLSGDWGVFIGDIAKIVAAKGSLSTLPDSFEGFGPSAEAMKNAASGGAAKNPIFDGFNANFNPSHAPEGPPAPPPIPVPARIEDPVATANQFKQLEGVLGSSATVTDQFNGRLAALVVTARAAGVPAEQLAGIQNQLNAALNASGGTVAAYGRAISGLNLDKAIALQTACTAALGVLLTAAQLIEKAKKAAREQEQTDEREQHRMPAAA